MGRRCRLHTEYEERPYNSHDLFIIIPADNNNSCALEQNAGAALPSPPPNTDERTNMQQQQCRQRTLLSFHGPFALGHRTSTSLSFMTVTRTAQNNGSEMLVLCHGAGQRERRHVQARTVRTAHTQRRHATVSSILSAQHTGGPVGRAVGWPDGVGCIQPTNQPTNQPPDRPTRRRARSGDEKGCFPRRPHSNLRTTRWSAFRSVRTPASCYACASATDRSRPSPSAVRRRARKRRWSG